ncbi:acylneuraminate cytidylyltransferase family protein [Patescibacteria group bacterium]|nr:acylneuraminate cytidylyltransferase family protein [Patescibacteria group bacterium]
MNIKVLGIIPARGGSKRIPRKNIVPVAGKPLISYTIQAAEESKKLDAFIVSTDDREIASLAQSLGADTPFLRPKKYARDDSQDIEYVTHALGWLEKYRGWQPEVIVLLPPDAPLKTGKDIDRAVEFLVEQDFDSVRTLVGPILHPPYKAMWVMKDAKKKLITPLFPQFVGMPCQQLPEYYLSVGMVYVTRSKFIKQGTLWGTRIGGYIMDAQKCIEIDEEDQLRQTEVILQNQEHV